MTVRDDAEMGHDEDFIALGVVTRVSNNNSRFRQ